MRSRDSNWHMSSKICLSVESRNSKTRKKRKETRSTKDQKHREDDAENNSCAKNSSLPKCVCVPRALFWNTFIRRYSRWNKTTLINLNYILLIRHETGRNSGGMGALPCCAHLFDFFLKKEIALRKVKELEIVVKDPTEFKNNKWNFYWIKSDRFRKVSLGRSVVWERCGLAGLWSGWCVWFRLVCPNIVFWVVCVFRQCVVWECVVQVCGLGFWFGWMERRSGRIVWFTSVWFGDVWFGEVCVKSLKCLHLFEALFILLILFFQLLLSKKMLMIVLSEKSYLYCRYYFQCWKNWSLITKLFLIFLFTTSIILLH